VTNAGVDRYEQLASEHHEPEQLGELDQSTVFLKVRTVQSELAVAMAVRTRFFRHGDLLTPDRSAFQKSSGLVGQTFELEMRETGCVTVEKVLALYTSRDPAISEAGLAARETIRYTGSFEQLIRRHREVWEALWRRFDLDVDVDESKTTTHPETILRLHLFHLLQTTSPNTKDLDVGVPARGWHGEAYRGHIFWDEIFIFPLLNFRMPEITRSLLNYRYRRLDAARRRADEAGYKGALFPWQSGSSGREESQRLHLNPQSSRWIPDETRLKYHVNAHIAYNVWQYYQVTGDSEYLLFYGAELILEVARFYSDLATYNETVDRYEISGIVGPDEYHTRYPGAEEPGLKNNAYTNVMAVWVLRKALEILKLLPQLRSDEIHQMLELGAKEKQRWKEITTKMRVCFHGDGIISQFEGYEQLEKFDWEHYRHKYGDIDRLDRILEAEGDSVNRYRASKQADVLMLFYLFSDDYLFKIFDELGYEYNADVKEKTVNYYLDRTSHGSTLSRVVHSWVLADMELETSWDLFTQALRSDVADIQNGTTEEGVHLGAMAGTVDLIQRSYAGIEIRDDLLHLQPKLPDELSRLHLDIRYRGHSIAVDITERRIRIVARECSAPPIEVKVVDETYLIEAGETRQFDV
jgi:alpha,alpha-trehalase